RQGRGRKAGGAAPALPAASLPPAAPADGSHPDEGATQLIPPILPGAGPFPAGGTAGSAGHPDEGATQLIPPIGAAGAGYGGPGGAPGHPDEAATQLIPPIVAGAPVPGAGHPDEAATQYIPPITAGAPPPAGVPGGPDAGGGPGDTRQLPAMNADFMSFFQEEEAAPPGRQRAAGPARGGRRRPAGGGRTQLSPVVLGAIVVTLCAVVGLAVGAALTGGDSGGSGEQQQDVDGSGPPGGAPEEADGADVEAARAAEAEAEAEAAAAAEAQRALEAEQAAELSGLLAESGESREAVVEAVAAVQECDGIRHARRELSAAGEQRRGLVERLDELTLEALPAHTELTSALRAAWQSSAEADDRFADWAREVREDRRRMCRGGSARHTDNYQQAARASGEASGSKERAAELWNPIAREHGLPEREPTEL
ncbi:hypothetical protein, partial [Streptomyces lonarensis]